MFRSMVLELGRERQLFSVDEYQIAIKAVPAYHARII